YAAEAGVPGHLVFGRGAARTHLVHVVRYGGRAWRRALAFRDALRADSRLRDAYAVLKRELAQRHGCERSRYTEAKSAFIQDLLGEDREPQP
ncbi:MAG TPA: GrpB family protein, partial [Gemmatimonadales bacterium]|nr:GrpB family protein [Gemmatimonadales bacterium]